MRYALYFAPDAKSDLWRFGCRVLGRDAETGEALEQLTPPGIDAATWAGWTASPRRYGFHATLKAPFALAEGCTEADLHAAVEAFARTQRPFRLPRLNVAALGSFVALIPAEVSADVDALAADCVRAFEPYRAPLGTDAMAKRLATSLSPRQHEKLMRWGYPYVFEDFQFHMTLTGSLPKGVVDMVAGLLQELYARDVGDGDVAVRGVALFREETPGEAFRLARRQCFPK